MRWEWAIGDGIILALLIREWFSIRRELARDAAARAAAGTPGTDKPDPNAADTHGAGKSGSGAPGHAEGQHPAHDGHAKARE